MDSIKVGLIQPAIEPYAVTGNLKLLSRKLRQLKKMDVRLAVLPEFFPTGNTLKPELLKAAIQSSDTVKEWLVDQSRALEMFIAGAYLSVEGRDVYNKFVVQEPSGRCSYHIKAYQPAVEAMYYKVSQDKKYVVDTSLGKVCLITCVEMHYPQVTQKDYSDCSMIIAAFAIPNKLSFLLKRLTEVPRSLARRNGTPVVLCSMGGDFRSNGSSIWPMKIRGLYAGRSGIYLPSGPVAGPLPAGGDEIITAEIPLGPGVEPPDLSVKVESGLPTFMRVVNAFATRRAEKSYAINLKRWLRYG